MGLTRNSDTDVIYLAVKHFSIWREISKPVEGSEEIEVTNPKTKEVLKKHGYRYRTLAGRVTGLVKYDTEQKYVTRYFGFKLHVQDAADRFVLDMPYHSQILRRFLRTAPSVDWSKPLSISAFKGKGGGDKGEQTGIWFQQGGETVKPFFTRETPHGMPEAVQDPDTLTWDFRAQHRWLIEYLKSEVIPDIEDAAKVALPPPEVQGGYHEPEQIASDLGDEMPPNSPITDDDIPF